MLAAGNLYLISLDGSRMDPWFAAAYLSSADGQAALGRMAVGTAIPNLALKDLRQVEVPVPPMDVQRSIGVEYRACLERIRELRECLEDARERAAETYTRGMRE